MNRLKIQCSLLGLFLCSFFIFSCNSGSGEDDGLDDDVDSVEVVEEPKSSPLKSAYFQIPSPNDLFSMIKSNDLEYNPELIVTTSPSYSGSKAQALNFGRFTADIAYTSSFSKYQESITNFDNMRKLGNDLGISYVFNEILVGRVKNNMENADSLQMISSDSYYRIIDMLEEKDKGSTLALIAAGGFVESLYLVINLAGDYTLDNETVQSIADQKLTFENLLNYLGTYSSDEQVASVVADLEDIKSTFATLEEEGSGGVQMKKNESGKMELGGNRISITLDQFNALRDKVNELRSRYIQGDI